MGIRRLWRRVRGSKPRILLLADWRGWAYDTAAQALAKRLSERFDLRIAYAEEQPAIAPDAFDLVHVFFWGETRHQRFAPDPRRVVKEISSHRWANDERFGLLSPEQMAARHLADAGTLCATSRRLQRLFAPLREVHWCPNGFEPGLFHPGAARRGALRVGWAGDLDDACKGVRDVLEPAAAAAGVELAIAGGDLGPAEMAAFYASLDVLAIASSAEGEPLTLIEGMACGAFPVAVDVGIVPELVRSGENGLIVPRTALAFRDAFLWCADHLAQLRDAGRANAAALLETRTWDAVVPHWQQLFERALEPELKSSWEANLGGNATLGEWPERASAAARLLAELPLEPGDAVLDLGCGRQTLRALLPAWLRYVPVDRVERTPDTQTLDLAREFPAGRHRAAVALGLLEYLDQPFELLARVAAANDFCVLSYNHDSAGERRRRQHWQPAIGADELIARVRAQGGVLLRRVDQGNGLVLYAFDFTGRGRAAGAGARRYALLSAAVTSTNSGDALITDAIRRVLAPADFEELPLLRPLDGAELERLNACSAAIVCGTNLYQQRFNCALDEDTLARIRVPLIPLGVGASAPIGELPVMAAADARIVRLLHERCALASVRDETTLRFVRQLGIENAELTGCPVLFHGLARPDFGASGAGPLHLAVRAALLHVSERWQAREIEILRLLCKELHPTLVLQSPRDLPIAEAIAREHGVEIRWDPRTQLADPLVASVLAAGRTAGFRLHFAMLGLAYGRPATLIGSDTRIASFCEMMGLPWHDVRKVRDRELLRELKRPPAGLDAFLRNWDALRDAMAHVLRANDLPFALAR